MSITVARGNPLKRVGKKYARIIAANNAMRNPFDLKVPVLRCALKANADIPVRINFLHEFPYYASFLF